MRALLVVNPTATTTSRRVRDVLARALGSDLKVDLAETTHRGHAIDLGRQAAEADLDLVVVLGGDGTVNEVVNGLLTDQPDGAPDGPALAIVPGGSTNVFSRSLGIARDPVEATGELLDALHDGRSRALGLGRADNRWFTFTAGLGMDADAVRRVESARAAGKAATPSRYTRASLRSYLALDHRHPALTLERPGQPAVEGLYLAIVANTTPWTYFRSVPITMSSTAGFDSGLDLVTLRRAGVLSTVWAAGGMLTDSGVRGRGASVFRDLSEFRLRASHPLHLEVDGDYLGMSEGLSVRSVPRAIRVISGSVTPPL